MEQFYTMVGVQAVLFIYIAVGYVLRKKEILTKEVRSGLTILILNILLPCMIFNSFRQDISFDQLMSAAAILGVAFGLCIMAWFLGRILWHKYPPERQKILRYGTLIPNSGVAGLPVIEMAYGTEGLFLAAIFIIPYRFLMWSLGISLFTKGDRKTMIRNILLNPGIVAVILGMTWMLRRLPVPGVADKVITGFSDATSPMAMILVGAILGDVELRGLLDKDAWLVTLVRLILLPICALVISKAIGFSAISTAVTVVLTGMPIGSTTAILAEKYGADSVFGSKCVFASTLMSLFTIPLLTLFL